LASSDKILARNANSLRPLGREVPRKPPEGIENREPDEGLANPRDSQAAYHPLIVMDEQPPKIDPSILAFFRHKHPSWSHEVKPADFPRGTFQVGIRNEVGFLIEYAQDGNLNEAFLRAVWRAEQKPGEE